MAIIGGEVQTGGEVRDNDGRLIVVGPGGVAIGGGGGGSDPLSDGTPGGALPTRTLWIAGANGAVLQGLQADASGRLRTVVEGTPAVSVSNFPATQPVSGTVGVSNFPATQPVSGTVAVSNFPASQAVTGPLTDTQLRASAVPVSGTFFQATQPVSGTVNIGTAPQVAVNNVETLTDNAGFTDGTSKLFPQGYVFDETAGTALTENDVAAARIDSKRAVVSVIEDATTRGQRAAVVPAADGLANSTGQVVVDQLHTFNGATWDRYHGNWRTTTGDTGAKTATFNGATQTNYDGVGAFIVVQLGTVSGTSPLMGVQLQVSYDAGTNFLTVGAASPNVNTTGQTILLMVGPTNWSQAPGVTPANLATGATATHALNMFLPRTWRLGYTISGTTPSFAITAVHVNYIGGA